MRRILPSLMQQALVDAADVFVLAVLVTFVIIGIGSVRQRLDAVEADVGAVRRGSVAAGGGALAGAVRIAVAIEVGVAQVGAGGAAGRAHFRVVVHALAQREVGVVERRVVGQADAALHVAAAVGRVARAQRAGAVAAADAAVLAQWDVVGIECAG